MEGTIEAVDKKEELRRKFIGLLNDYNEEPVLLSREERKFMESENELLTKYEKSKFRRTWLTLVYGQLEVAEMSGVEPDFFRKKAEEMKEFLPFFSAVKKALDEDAGKIKELRNSNEFAVTEEVIERTNKIIREAINKLS